MIRTLVLFVAAGVAEIGGGYLVWRSVRADGSWWVGLVGAGMLVLYGLIPTLQRETSFGRVYAAYGGVFVIASLLWGWRFDHDTPDRWDLLGAAIVALGVTVIFFVPRHAA